MASISKKYNNGRYTVDAYEFQRGGDGDVKFCNFIKDEAQGFGVPAKSFSIENHGGGAGENIIYYRTIHNLYGTSRQSRLLPDCYKNYLPTESRYYGILVWASNANCCFSLDATPGEWTDAEVVDFIGSPLYKKTLSFLDEQTLTGELVL